MTRLDTVRYFSGFTGDSTILIITHDRQILITDGRYDDQARLECPSFEILTVAALDRLQRLLPDWIFKTLTLEPLRQIKDAVEIKSVIAPVVLGQVVGIGVLAVSKPGGVV